MFLRHRNSRALSQCKVSPNGKCAIFGTKGLLICFLFAGLALIQGCISAQFTGTDGKPRLAGFGSAGSVEGTDDQVYRVAAPGLTFRFHPHSPGVTLGWHEILLFFPPDIENYKSTKPVARQTRSYGVDLEVSSVSIGYDREFTVRLPSGNGSVCQYIHYAENDPTRTIVLKEEYP